MFVKPTCFEFFQITYDYNPNPKTRLRFTYCRSEYDLPVTDPDFLKKYQSNPNFPNDFSQIYITISIGVVHNNWHNKLVAGIILS